MYVYICLYRATPANIILLNVNCKFMCVLCILSTSWNDNFFACVACIVCFLLYLMHI